ncbi:Steroid 5 alpha-reductase 3 [Dermatophagoides pteronyssinus]|uniref:Polyprenal reductase n=1 Tax=Dermatophagoides pteronyssinus TaxID=6956 RepID=A0ABQ8ISR3_DERPT|nr:Steroid 5 alpha-reductase 3 [Dermatophagoides pteronyssinus]
MMMITMITGLILFWNLLSIGIIITGTITLCDLEKIPEFIRSLIFYGKFKSLKSKQSNEERWSPKSYYQRLLSIIDTIVRMLEVPKYWFRHFYILSFCLNSILLIRMFYLTKFELKFLIGLQWLQSLRRLYETFYVSKFSDNTINFVHYFVGILFYLTIGLATYNNDDNGDFERHNSTDLSSSMMIVIIFIASSIVQYQSHQILANLRNNKPNTKNDYFIPQGGLFDYISCPHYLSEIIIYVCLWLLSNRSNLWSTMLMFVIVNQTIAAQISNRWYRKRFGDRYPKTIKALIPFMF